MYHTGDRRRGKKRTKVHYPCLREAPQVLLVMIPGWEPQALTGQCSAAPLSFGTGCIWRHGQQPGLPDDRSRSVKLAIKRWCCTAHFHNAGTWNPSAQPDLPQPRAPQASRRALLQRHKPKEGKNKGQTKLPQDSTATAVSTPEGDKHRFHHITARAELQGYTNPQLHFPPYQYHRWCSTALLLRDSKAGLLHWL